jgi:uncharacterized protein YjiS (DUF1127 family)
VQGICEDAQEIEILDSMKNHTLNDLGIEDGVAHPVI